MIVNLTDLERKAKRERQFETIHREKERVSNYRCNKIPKLLRGKKMY